MNQVLEVLKIRISNADTDNSNVSELLIVSSGDAEKCSLGLIQQKPNRLANYVDGKASEYVIIDTCISSDGGEELIT